MSYVLAVERLWNRTLGDVRMCLQEHGRIRVRDLRLMDLVRQDGVPLVDDHGVYLFFEPDGSCAYVGKSHPLSFVERVSWHFAQSEFSRGNRLIQNMVRAGAAPTLEAALEMLMDFSLVPVSFGTHFGRIAPFEKLLIPLMPGRFNRQFSGSSIPPLDLTLAEAVEG